MKKIVEFLANIIENAFMAIRSLLWIKDKKIVLIGAWFGERFADNSRYLYQYLNEKKEELGLEHVVWVTYKSEIVSILRNMNCEAYLTESPESLYYHKKARYHIVCNAPCCSDEKHGDILGKYSYRAKRINLWHGVFGAKGVMYESVEYKNKKSTHPVLYTIKEYLTAKNSLFKKICGMPGGWSDYFCLSPTAASNEIFKRNFLLRSEKFIKVSPPRFCNLIWLTDDEKDVLNYIGRFSNIILYAPTFRNDSLKFSMNEIHECVLSYLADENILWIQKPHSADFLNNDDHSQSANVLNLPKDFDVNIIIPFISILITDYSSIMNDAMYYYKPIIYYIPDLNEYASNDRGFIMDPYLIMCGAITQNSEEFKKAVIGHFSKKNPIEIDEKYIGVREKYLGEKNNLDEIWRTIINTVEKNNKKHNN